MWTELSSASSSSADRTTLIEAGPGAPAASSAVLTAVAIAFFETRRGTPERTVMSTRYGGR